MEGVHSCQLYLIVLYCTGIIRSESVLYTVLELLSVLHGFREIVVKTPLASA